MKKLFSFVFAFFVLVGICSANGQKMNIDYESKRNLYGDFVIIPMDNTVTVTDGCITIAPKREDVTYTISGYFNGQIVVMKKNTIIKLNNAFIENTSSCLSCSNKSSTLSLKYFKESCWIFPLFIM